MPRMSIFFSEGKLLHYLIDDQPLPKCNLLYSLIKIKIILLYSPQEKLESNLKRNLTARKLIFLRFEIIKFVYKCKSDEISTAIL